MRLPIETFGIAARFEKSEIGNRKSENDKMGIKKLTPTSAARRYQTYLTRDELTVGAVPEKSLLEPKKRISGRNNDGRITVRRRGGGPKRYYLVVDLKSEK